MIKIKTETENQAMLLEAMIRFAEIFANENIGDCGVDIAKVICLAKSPQFNLRMAWECQTLEDYYKLIEDMVLGGFPIWEYLKISEWTKNIMDREFAKEQERIKKTEREMYKCYICEYYEEITTYMGIIHKCHKPRAKSHFREREIFEFKKDCNDYKYRRKGVIYNE